MTNNEKNLDQEAGPPGIGITTPTTEPDPNDENRHGDSDEEDADDPVTGNGPEDPS